MNIKSSVRDYSVEFIQDLTGLIENSKYPGAFYLIDEKVATLYPGLIEGIETARVIKIDAIEENKKLENIQKVIVDLIDRGINKTSSIIVIGGGVLQDIGGFIASIMFRGIDWVLIPTTLLAQCDSCIGSKTSVNIGKFKNQLGTFYPPSRVLLYPGFTKTLKPYDFLSGACEGVKLYMIDGRTDIKEVVKKITGADREAVLTDFIKDSLDIKKAFIEDDEYDRGKRNLLNYGHTIGHAIESKTGYLIPHGLAVGFGILGAIFISYKEQLISKEYLLECTEELWPLIRDFEAEVCKLDPTALIESIKKDKKSNGREINFILTGGNGVIQKRPLLFEKQLEPYMKDLWEWFNSLKSSPVK